MKYAVSAVALAAAFGFAGVAHAGGSLKDTPVEPVYHAPIWEGLYFGGFGGYAWSDVVYLDNKFGDHPVDEKPFDMNGDLFGVQAGYDVQHGNVVFGLVGDYSSVDADGGYEFGSGSQRREAEIESIWTARGRVGYAIDSILVYGTAGFAGLDTKVQRTRKDPKPATSETFATWVAGVGAEVQMGYGFSAFAEYLHVGLDDEIVGTDGAKDPFVFDDVDVVKVGINFKFGRDHMDALK